MSQRLDVLVSENEKINSLMNQILHEINTITRNNPILNERQDFYKRTLERLEEGYRHREKKLYTEIEKAENELRILKESIKFNNNNSNVIESMIINNSSLMIAPDKKADFLESENRKLESEIENWKVQYWNLEKKVKKHEVDVNPELKYTEIDLKEIISKVNRQHVQTQNELMNKMNFLEIEINKLSKRGNDPPQAAYLSNFRQFTSPDRQDAGKNTANFHQKNISSERKDKTFASTSAFKVLRFRNVGESDKKINTSKQIVSNSLKTDNQANGNTVKKENENISKKTNNFALSYTEKILRKMKK